MSSLKKNIGLQTLYQILETCLPLITAPYLARVLGATQQGIFSYTQSIVNYFTMIAMLGMGNYGTRTISKVKNNKIQLNIIFKELYLMQLITGCFVCITFIIYFFFICKTNKTLILIQGITLFACLMNVNWLFFGLEKFKITVTRNFFIRIFTLIAILFFVQKDSDLWKYTLIMSLSTLLSNMILFILTRKEINWKNGWTDIKLESIILHIKPNLVLFVPIAALSIYHIMDKIMLGIFSTYEETGFYYNTDKVINIPVSILSGVGTVMLPRMSVLIVEKDICESNKLFKLSLEGLFCAGCAMSFGIAAISDEFVPLFFGKGFEKCIFLIKILAPVLAIKALSLCMRQQFLIPRSLEKYYIIAVFYGAGINIVCNLFFIKKLGAFGAILGTLIAELTVCILQFYLAREEIRISDLLIKFIIYILFGFTMYIVIRLVSNFIYQNLIAVIIEIIIGIIYYGTLCILFWKQKKSIFYILFKNSIKRGSSK